MDERPLYETAEDLDNEREVVKRLKDCWRLTEVKKLPRSYGLDYRLIRDGEIVAFCEIKCRNLSFGYGDGFHLSLNKVMRARAMMDVTQRHCVLVVRFSDGKIRYADFEHHKDGCRDIGRVDRDDPADIEPGCVFPWSTFKELAG
jgi:hypothetical protein